MRPFRPVPAPRLGRLPAPPPSRPRRLSESSSSSSTSSSAALVEHELNLLRLRTLDLHSRLERLESERLDERLFRQENLDVARQEGLNYTQAVTYVAMALATISWFTQFYIYARTHS